MSHTPVHWYNYDCKTLNMFALKPNTTTYLEATGLKNSLTLLCLCPSQIYIVCLPAPRPIFLCEHHRPSTKVSYLPPFPTFVHFLYFPYIFFYISPMLTVYFSYPWTWLIISLDLLHLMDICFKFPALAFLALPWIIVAMPSVTLDMVLS